MAASGDGIDLVLELRGVPVDGSITGTVLDRVESGSYVRTAQQARVRLSTDTSVVMGEWRDIPSGAVILDIGHVAAPWEVAADRVVVLTGSVQVR
jgi:hypothetical protein